MRLPNHEQALIDPRKLADYCLNPQHEEGRHKARVFAATLALAQSDSAWLSEEILHAIAVSVAVEQSPSAYGRRFILDFDLRRGQRSARVRTAWIVKDSEGFPRLTSCYVL